MKRARITIFLIINSLLLCACGNKQDIIDSNKSKETISTQIVQSENETIESEVDNLIIGEWIAQAVIYDNKVISFEENSALADLYDTEWIFVNEDNSFSKQSGAFTQKGTWERIDVEQFENAYYFKQESSSRLSIDDKGNYDEIILQSDKEYLVVLSNDNVNTLILSEPSKSEDDILLVYIKSGNEQKNETTYSEYAFTNQFGTSTTKCAYKGCDNYIAPSGDTNCCVEHSNLCLECNKYIDSDAMYCMDCLNGAINSNSSNSSIFSDSITRGEENALQRAYDYLEYQAFSYSGLIEQLEFEGFTNSEATFAVDNCGANWNEQAVLRAEQYLEYSSFSRSGLKEQLEFEGFTSSQAEYAVNQVY